MKQFDLQEYLKNPTRPIITRDGRAARIISCNSKVWAPCFLEEFKKFSDGSGAVGLIGFISFVWQRCIPYNDETMHLVNTEKDCPEYYKWWEDLCQK